MGFLSRLFGTAKDDTGAGAAPSMGMLRTARNGGYNKGSVLTAIASLDSEILALTDAVEKKKNGVSYTLPQPADIRLETVAAGGFNEEDIDSYIGELRKKIAELRSQL